MSILEEIYAHKRVELADRKADCPVQSLEQRLGDAPPVPDFAAAICDRRRAAPRLIAEVKQRSPSKGLLARDFNPLRLARLYAANGAAAISVLTDAKFFGGSLEHLASIARKLEPESSRLPLLRKDFIFDRYQVLEARLAGASAVLLITAMLEQSLLSKLRQEIENLGMTALVEVHDLVELERAIDAGSRVVGVNNRDLHTFEVDLETTLSLVGKLPAEITLVSESGIRTAQDVHRLGEAGVDAILVGEGIVTAEDPAEVVRNFAQVDRSVSEGNFP